MLYHLALPDQVHDIIGATPRPLLSTLSDLPMWNLSPNGQFNPRIAYLFAANLPLIHNAAAWNWLWKSHTLPRVKTFLWLACHDRLHTKNQPLKRHVINDDSCPLPVSHTLKLQFIFLGTAQAFVPYGMAFQIIHSHRIFSISTSSSG